MKNKTTQTRAEIINLISTAKAKVQIAVSWMTDEMIIDEIIKSAGTKKVQVILSCDPLNVFRYEKIMQIKKNGGQVLKQGANFPGEKGFMHAKFIIIDEVLAYGGSYNFTNAASYNFENFYCYAPQELEKLKNEFNYCWLDGKDYTVGFESPKAVKDLIAKQFEMNESFRNKLSATMDSQFATERENIVKTELELIKKRNLSNELQSSSAIISPEGRITNGAKGVISKPHRFYGGRELKSRFDQKKPAGCFHFAKVQMEELKRKFPFLKSRIKNDTLISTGNFSPRDCESYSVRIEYRLGAAPKVYITSKDIFPSADIHMYREGSLCLFYPGDLKWGPTTSISEYTIPWIFEWIVFYEIYLLTGIWEAPSVAHGSVSPICIS